MPLTMSTNGSSSIDKAKASPQWRICGSKLGRSLKKLQALGESSFKITDLIFETIKKSKELVVEASKKIGILRISPSTKNYPTIFDNITSTFEDIKDARCVIVHDLRCKKQLDGNQINATSKRTHGCLSLCASGTNYLNRIVISGTPLQRFWLSKVARGMVDKLMRRIKVDIQLYICHPLLMKRCVAAIGNAQ
ncbi:hypothetical protein VNO77_07544 [Canavalia gladiata]|uniref:Uncharacterized protein n=1 Tax=Canavalia gladiata TaxID=3824 RepID=A0AAN9MEG0_CANGL